MIAFIFVLLIASMEATSQPEHLYSSVRGSHELLVTTRGSYLISRSFVNTHAFVRVEDRSEILDLPKYVYAGWVDVLTDSLVLVNRRYILDLFLKEVIDTLEWAESNGTVSISADHSTVAQISDSGQVYVWRIDDRGTLYNRRHAGYNRVRLSPDGQYLFICNALLDTQPRPTLPLLIIRTRDTTWTKTLTESDDLACVTDDGTVAFSTTRSGQIAKWDLITGERVRTSLEYFSVATGSVNGKTIELDASERSILVSGINTAIFSVDSLQQTAAFKATLIRIDRDRRRALLVNPSASGSAYVIDLNANSIVDSTQLAPIAKGRIENVCCTDDLRLIYKTGGMRIERYDRESKHFDHVLSRVGIEIPWFLSQSEFVSRGEWYVCSLRTGDGLYRLLDRFELIGRGLVINYDRFTHRFWTAEYQSGAPTRVSFMDPTDTSTMAVEIQGSSVVRVVGRGEILLVRNIASSLAAYSTRTGSLLWSGVAGHTIRTDTAHFAGDRSVLVRGNVEWYVIDVESGTVVDTIPSVLLSNTREVLFAEEPASLVLFNTPQGYGNGGRVLLLGLGENDPYDSLEHVISISLADSTTLEVRDTAGHTRLYDMRQRSWIDRLPALGISSSLQLAKDVLVITFYTGRVSFIQFDSGRELFSIERFGDLQGGYRTHYDPHSHVIAVYTNDAVHTYNVGGLLTTSNADGRTVGQMHPQIALRVAPNPMLNTSTVYVTFSDVAGQQVEIFDIFGRIYGKYSGSGVNMSQIFTIDATSFPPGVLFVRASDAKSSIAEPLLR